MNKQAFWCLENINVEGIFCPNKLMNQNKNHDQKTYKKGTYIYLPNDESDKIYFLTEGRIKIGNYGEEGKEITKAILAAGEVFGELAIVGESNRRDFAYVMEDSKVCTVAKDDMKNLLRDHSALNLFFMKIMGNRVLDMEKRLEGLVFKDSRTRIVDFLLELVEKKGERIGYEMVVRKFLTHQEIANMTATSRQTVTTVLNELRTKNLLTFNRKRLLVRDVGKLSAERAC